MTTAADLSNLTAQVGTAPEDRQEYDVIRDAPSTDPDSGLTCQQCGKDISHMYSGRGRKPKYCEEHKKGNASRVGSSAGTATRGDVQQAVNSLEQGYQLIQMGLMMFGAHGAATTLRESIPDLSQKNAQYLAADKDLVRSINKVGKAGGRAGFFINQGLVLAPVVILAAQELGEKWASDAKEKEGDAPFAAFAESEE